MLIIKSLDFAGIILKLGLGSQNYVYFQVILIFIVWLFGYKIR